MSNQKKCPKCGAALPENEAAGLCVACLLALGLPAEVKPAGSPATIALSLLDSLTEKSGDRIGRYKLLQKIGEGGCGVVYMADQEEPVKRRVALKVIKPGMDTKEVLGRFEAERQALALMDHSNIAKVFDAGATENGRPFFVMELVRGIPITRHCDENKLSTEQRLKLFIQVCQAIQHAHQKGIIHRDIKPSNVLVADHDGVPVPIIIDFGIAKATSDQKLTDKTVFTALEQFLGTPAYMSPEQAKLSGLDIDTRSDIYSLGVLLYELLTGKTPFDAKKLLEAGFDEIRRIIREVEPPRPSLKLSTLAAEEQTTTARQRQTDSLRLMHIIRGDLDWIVMKCLEKDRNRRYETANGLAMELTRVLKNEPVFARPPSNLYRLHKMVGRNKLAVTAASAVFVALVAGLAGSTWEAIRAKNAERSEHKERLVADSAAGEAQRQRQDAENAKAEKSHALETVRIRAAEDYFADNTPIALAYLARVLRDDPGNHVAAERLLSALTYRNFTTPQTEPLRHGAKVNTVKFSPDGTQVVTASDDGAAQVWNAMTGERIGQPFRHKKAVGRAEFSPDGRLVVTASEDGTAGIWTVGDNQSSGVILSHSTRALNAAKFSPDGRSVATASDDGTVLVWNVPTGQRIGGPFVHSAAVLTEEFSPDGKYLLTGSADHTAILWDLQTGKPAFPPLKHGDSVVAVGFAPNSKRFVTASWDHDAYIWDALTGKLLQTLEGHHAVLFAVQFSSDGRWVLTASKDTTVMVWDAGTGVHKSTIYVKTPVPFACFSPDADSIVATSVQGSVHLYSTTTDRPISEAIEHLDAVESAALSPQGDRLATACADGTARIWNLPGKHPVLTLRHNSVGETNSVADAVFDNEGLRILTGCQDGNARLWDARTGELRKVLPGRAGPINCVRFSPNGRLVATGSYRSDDSDGSARIWDPNNGEAVGMPLVFRAWAEERGSVQDIEFSPDNNQLLVTGYGSLQLLKIGDTNIFLKAAGVPVGPAQSAVFSPDGRRIAATTDGNFTCVWNISSDQSIFSLEHREKTCAVRFAPDGSYLATASWDGTARIWNPTNGVLLVPPLRHEGAIVDVEFSPDSRSVITASGDGTARIWSVANGLALTVPLRHQRAVMSAQFSPDGNRVATASMDGTARVWDTKTGLPISEPLRHDDAVNIVRFSPDGEVLLTASNDGTARLWAIPRVNQPAPDWFMDLAEALGGQHLNDQEHFEPVDSKRILEIARICKTSSGTDFFSRWGRWFFSDHRTQDPWNFPS